MGRPIFELDAQDAAGRLGRLTIPRAGLTVETPALLPVVNPHLQLISPRTLAEEFGAEILITNAYVFYQSDQYRDAVLDDGLHEVLDFPGAIMTDSGSFQLAEYGDIDVDTAEILAFQDEIGSDIATPVDIPTPPDASREHAETDLAETENALDVARDYPAGDMLQSAPIQGSTYLDLRARAAQSAIQSGLDVYPIGAVVPLLTTYRYAETVDIVAAAKRELPESAPVHLFGAGHPMMFALAVAIGCDLFDSAAYALYAREGRYLTATGTEALDDLGYFPCECPVCAESTPEQLRQAPRDEQAASLARHNLHVTFGEMRRVKQAIRDGTLLHLVEQRARSHPALLDGYRALLAHETFLEARDPTRSERPFFHLSTESAIRPEVTRHHDRLARLAVPEHLSLVDRALLGDLPEEAPWHALELSDVLAVNAVEIDDANEWWIAMPPFGPTPPTLLYSYPLTAECPTRLDPAAYAAATEGINRLVNETAVAQLTLYHRSWPSRLIDRLSARIEAIQLGDQKASY